MAQLAQALASREMAVFRFDRRGIGDSSGENAEFTSSNDDLAAAIAAFRAECPALVHICGLGLCDAAAALLLHPAAQALDRFILLNPWTLETAAQAASKEEGEHQYAPALPPAAAIRARYMAKLKNPRELWRLISGGVNFAKLWRGLRQARQAPPAITADSLPARLQHCLAQLAMPTLILLASKDSTAMAFMAHWHSRDWADVRANRDITIVERDSASHSFASQSDAAWLADQVRKFSALAG
jgi:exosortase A-associated hydrolase 1